MFHQLIERNNRRIERKMNEFLRADNGDFATFPFVCDAFSSMAAFHFGQSNTASRRLAAHKYLIKMSIVTAWQSHGDAGNSIHTLAW